MRPESKGSIHITAADPRRPPAINFNFLSAPIDAALTVLSSAGIATLPTDTGEIVRIADERALTVMQGEAARIHENDSVNVLDPSLRKRLSKGLAIADAAIQEALDERATLRDHFEIGRAHV